MSLAKDICPIQMHGHKIMHLQYPILILFSLIFGFMFQFNPVSVV